MTRRASILVNLLSATACAAACAAGARGRIRPLSWAREFRGSRAEIGVWGGRLGPEVALGFSQGRQVSAGPRPPTTSGSAGKVEQSAFAFVEVVRASRTVRDRRTGRWADVRSWGLRFPVVYFVFATGILPGITLARWLGGVKPPRPGPDGRCARCGHDMAGASGTCPRCGVSVVRVGYFGI